MDKNVKMLDFTQRGDERGRLVVVEGMKDVPFGFFVHRHSLSSELRDETQQPTQKRVNARNHRKECGNDHENDARRLKNGGEFRPGHSLKLGEGFLKLCPYATKPAGFLVFSLSSVCHFVPHA